MAWWHKILVSNCFLLRCRSMINFCVLIIYPVPLLNSLKCSTSFIIVWLLFFGRLFGTFLCNHVTCKYRQFSFFLVCMPFISLSCLTALHRTSITMLNRSGESTHPCLIPNFRGKAYGNSLSPLSVILPVGCYLKMLL